VLRQAIFQALPCVELEAAVNQIERLARLPMIGQW
jgi:uncharacterized protein YbaP (TraB family)